MVTITCHFIMGHPSVSIEFAKTPKFEEFIEHEGVQYQIMEKVWKGDKVEFHLLETHLIKDPFNQKKRR